MPPDITDKPLLVIVIPPEPTVTPPVIVMPLLTLTEAAVSCWSVAVPDETVRPPVFTVIPVS
jgi:hypothetical protein